MLKTMDAKASSDRDLILERIIDAPRANVYRCWTEPELMKQWFTPRPYTTPVVEADVRPGGSNFILMKSPAGHEMPNHGVYLEVVPNERLVFTDAYTQAWQPSAKPFMTVVLTFADAGPEHGPNKTKYTAVVHHWTAEDCASHEKMGFHRGWGIAADQLEALAKTLWPQHTLLRRTFRMTRLPRISPCLWFETNAEEAVNFYLSAFQSGRIVDTVRYGAGGRMPKGTVLTISFELNGHPLMALNGGPHEKFNDAISLQVLCDTQEDIDTLWQRLTAGGGKPVQCGWLKDKYGVSWQIVPAQLQDMMQAADAEKAARVMAAVMKMVKLDIEQLQAAYDG